MSADSEKPNIIGGNWTKYWTVAKSVGRGRPIWTSVVVRARASLALCGRFNQFRSPYYWITMRRALCKRCVFDFVPSYLNFCNFWVKQNGAMRITSLSVEAILACHPAQYILYSWHRMTGWVAISYILWGMRTAPLLFVSLDFCEVLRWPIKFSENSMFRPGFGPRSWSGRKHRNGVHSLKWWLTDRHLRWGTLAHPRSGRAEADQCKSSEFLQELRISGFPRFWVTPTWLRAKLLWIDAIARSKFVINF